MKTCSRCHQHKSVKAFIAHPRYRFGVTGWCKVCRAEVSKTNKDRIRLLPKPLVVEKECRGCHAVKPSSDFPALSSNRDGLNHQCKVCLRSKDTRPGQPEEILKRLQYRLKTNYGMTLAAFFELLAQQGNRCAICRDELTRPHIDHDHDTGVVRGLLCAWCNGRLPALENAAFFENASAYLAYHRQPRPQHVFRAHERIGTVANRRKAELRKLRRA